MAATGATLSLKVTSRMVGALAMELKCAILEHYLRDGDLAGALTICAFLPGEAALLGEALASGPPRSCLNLEPNENCSSLRGY